MAEYTNINKVALSMALWLAHDTYDRQRGAISVTGLIKPVKQTLMSGRALKSDNLPATDISGLVKSRMGTAIHDSIEAAWTSEHIDVALKALGWPESVAQRVIVNPQPEDLKPDSIPVYMERRTTKEIAGTKISGKFDFVAEDCVRDFKSTSVYSFLSGSKDKDYQMQGSIYRWLNPDIIKSDVMYIDFIITDFSAGMAKSTANYPPHATPSKKIPLLSIDDTEEYIVKRITTLDKLQNTPEAQLPPCTQEELWQDAPKFKYYANPANKKRATKNFDNFLEANRHKIKAGKGEVVKVDGKARACNYCGGFNICEQRKQLSATGALGE